MTSIYPYLVLSALLFAIGLAGALTRRNAIIVLIGIELMLNAANLNFIAFWRYGPHPEALTGMIFVIFSIGVAAAEAAVGLALIISVCRHYQTANVDKTQKRLDEALKRGDVVKSQEVNTWFIIAGATLVLATFSGGMSPTSPPPCAGCSPMRTNSGWTGRRCRGCSRRSASRLIAALAVPFLLLMLAALAGNMIQHRLVWSFEALAPKLSKISPARRASSGCSRMQALANFVKGLVKLVAGRRGADRADVAGALPHHGARAQSTSPTFCRSRLTLALKLMGAVVAMMAVVAAADYLFQYRQWYERQKMSLREMKEEFKQSEGDPAIKGKMRQCARRACASA